ncbi:hypothetical protein [Candidatus Nitrososphaera sp. FF02]|uniref:hypothetical protein n=1 Tax=Candidatus Nitrososphaera sp. FF02 TaxID=3398226 RepID=UPI0039EB9FE6
MPFGLFKKKEPEKTESAAFMPQAPAGDALSVQDAQALLDSVEAARVQSLCARLAPARENAAHSLAALSGIAGSMEKEKLKLEDLEKRYGSNIENARKMVISALKREASVELPQAQTLADAKKFRERMESMLHRFGEVSGSHSKMLNYFMKKHAGSMKDEFGELDKVLKDVKAAMSAFDAERAPQVRCASVLNTVSQKASSARADEIAAQAVSDRAAALESELASMKGELAALEGSAEFAQAKESAEKLAGAEKRQEEFRAHVAEMFSHVSRALSKYSVRRLQRDRAAPPHSVGGAVGRARRRHGALFAAPCRSLQVGRVRTNSIKGL